VLEKNLRVHRNWQQAAFVAYAPIRLVEGHTREFSTPIGELTVEPKRSIHPLQSVVSS
jgi:hypothetical protein